MSDKLAENLKKHLEKESSQHSKEDFRIVPRTHWCGVYSNLDGSTCCWRHWIGLPRRWGLRHPYYPFQEQLIAQFYQYDYHWILKPPKIGATELFLGLAMHEACINPEWANGQVAIVVGTSGINEAEKMIGRCKDMIQYKDQDGRPTGKYMLPINQDYNTKKEFSINTVEFRAHPADNIDSIRSQPNMRMILKDEGAFFKQIEQESVRSASEHYIGGAKVKLVWVSTAGDSPSGAMYDIGQELDVTEGGVYRKHYLDYREGLKVDPRSGTTLYDPQKIEEARTLRTFGRNYLQIWGAGSGDIFDRAAIEEMCKWEYDIPQKSNRTRVLNIDPGYGSSKSGIIGVESRDGVVHVIQAEAIERPSQNELFEQIKSAVDTYGYNHIQVDGHWSGLIKDCERVKSTMGINFNERGQIMTDTTSIAVSNKQVKVHRKFSKLKEELMSAKKGKNGQVDKKLGKFDMYDGFIMGVSYFVEYGQVGYVVLPSD